MYFVVLLSAIYYEIYLIADIHYNLNFVSITKSTLLLKCPKNFVINSKTHFNYQCPNALLFPCHLVIVLKVLQHKSYKIQKHTTIKDQLCIHLQSTRRYYWILKILQTSITWRENIIYLLYNYTTHDITFVQMEYIQCVYYNARKNKSNLQHRLIFIIVRDRIIRHQEIMHSNTSSLHSKELNNFNLRQMLAGSMREKRYRILQP